MSEEKPIGLKVKEEKIANVELPQIDCNMMDARTRKVIIFLLNEELKRYKSYPKRWVEGSIVQLEGIKAGLEMCTRIRKKRQDAQQEPSPQGKSPEST